jgi:hypothetical protein
MTSAFNLRPEGFQLFELLHPASEVLVRAETCVQIGPENLFGQLDADDPGPHAQQIDVAVSALLHDKTLVDS